MLILLPPSEGKEYPDDGVPALDLRTLALPELAQARGDVLDALIRASGQPNARQILKVGKTVAPEVAANAGLFKAPAVPAWQVYSGVLYDSLQASSLTSAQLRRAAQAVLVFSGLFGVTGLTDRIPAYRCAMDVKLPGVGGLGTFWKQRLREPMTRLVGDELLVDCRSGAYQRPFPGDPRQVIEVNNFTEHQGERRVVTHFAKAARGELTGMLLRSEAWPESAEELAGIAAQRWKVELRPAEGKRPHQLGLISVS